LQASGDSLEGGLAANCRTLRLPAAAGVPAGELVYYYPGALTVPPDLVLEYTMCLSNPKSHPGLDLRAAGDAVRDLVVQDALGVFGFRVAPLAVAVFVPYCDARKYGLLSDWGFTLAHGLTKVAGELPQAGDHEVRWSVSMRGCPLVNTTRAYLIAQRQRGVSDPDIEATIRRRQETLDDTFRKLMAILAPQVPRAAAR
jgi:hypothetical protein